MRTIYIDSENKCHPVNDGTMTAVETEIFDGKCDEFINGYCIELDNAGNIKAYYPWCEYWGLDAAQREYERERIKEQENIIAELDSALLDAYYNNLTERL